MKQLTCMVIVLITVAYITIGGIVFHVLEYDNETAIKGNATGFLLHFLENNTCLSENELRQLLTVTLEAYRSGFVVGFNQTSTASNWDYYSSVFFATSVVTTIGYGNAWPRTLAGRIFCAVFALVGIPLFLVSAVAVGARFYWLTKKAQSCCFRKKPDGTRTAAAKICGDLFYLLIGIGLFIIVPGVLFMLVEGWTLLEGIYYSFLTIITVGFGDYVPGTKDKDSYKGFRDIYRLSIAAWIFIGLSWMGGFISALEELYCKQLNKNDLDAVNTAFKNSQEESRNQRELMRVYSLDSGYAGMNGTKAPSQYNRQTSVDSLCNSVPSLTYEDVETNSDTYQTKL